MELSRWQSYELGQQALQLVKDNPQEYEEWLKEYMKKNKEEVV